MALDPHYITDGPLEEAFLSKDSGLPLAGGFITFYRDSSRITPKTVYQLTGAPPNYQYVPLDNPLELNSIGVVQNNGGDNVVIYYYPWLDDGVTPDLYYIEVTDSNDVVQFTREAWPNSAAGGGGGGSDSLPVQNQISNPQFTQILINDVPNLTPSTTTYTVSGSELEFELAPDWTLIINGTDDVEVERLSLSGSLQAPTNPPYALSIAVGLNITSCHLRQRFYTNSGLWTSTASNPLFLSTGMVIKNLINADTNVKMFYQASNGALNTTPLEIFDQDIEQLSDYTFYTGGSIEVPASDDVLDGEDGYVDIYVQLSPASSVAITSVQVVPAVNVETAPVLPYDIASANRAEALLGDYYLPRVTTSNIPSILTAWDFPLNPAQFGTTKTITFGTPAYVWDQTVCNSTVGNVAVARNSVTNALQLTPASANASMYMIQYLTGAQAKEILYNRLSSNISAYLTAAAGVVTVRAYLYSGTAASVVPILPLSLVTLASNGTVSSPAAGWTEIARSGLDTARAEVTADRPTIDNDIKFTGWEIVDPTLISDTDKFAMVVTFAWTTAPVINVLSISLNKGDLPTRPAAQALSDVLSECQFYYEITKNPGVALTASGAEGSVIAQQYWYNDVTTNNSFGAGRSFGVQYKIQKRTPPTFTFYSTVGTVNNVSRNVSVPNVGIVTDDLVSSRWSKVSAGYAGVSYRYNSATALTTGGAATALDQEIYISFHYEADCRLGIIA
jgi:hypothetical protein